MIDYFATAVLVVLAGVPALAVALALHTEHRAWERVQPEYRAPRAELPVAKVVRR